MVKVIKSESKAGGIEKYKGGFGKLTDTFKTKAKRNLIILGAVALIGGAIYLNWVLFANSGKDNVYNPSTNAGVVTEEPGTDVGNPDDEESYFAMAQLNRENAYDSAYNTLLAVTTSANATEEAKEKDSVKSRRVTILRVVHIILKDQTSENR